MNAQDFLNDRSDYHIRFLFKSFLLILEDLKNTHDIQYEKLYESLSEEHQDLIKMADYFNDDFFAIYRKKVLDLGNSALRDYYSEIENLTVSFKFKK